MGLPVKSSQELTASIPKLEKTLAELQQWAKERLAPYKVPRALQAVEALPRNAMGKVVKPEVAALFTRRL
jgi:malonyl-CoA/methylmalonyl-CoA synthetase